MEKKVFKSVEEELDAWSDFNKNSEYGKKLNAIKNAVEGCFPTYYSYPGVATNEFNNMVANYDYGFNGYHEDCTRVVVYGLTNYDIIYSEDGVVNVGRSNRKDIAKLVVELQKISAKL